MKIKTKNIFFIVTILSFTSALFSSCNQENKLPIYGERDWVTKTIDGKEVTDTIYHSIPKFKFLNQNNDTITESYLKNKIYVADFFFTTCPTICPVMKKQMTRVYEKFKSNPNFEILSHSIDPEHDTPAVLKKYAVDLGVDGANWQFLSGPKEEIYEIGQKSYMIPAKADSTVAGGYIHSGAFILIDKDKRVRGMYDGTTEEGTTKLITDINTLLKEYE